MHGVFGEKKSNKHSAFYVALRTQPQLAILLGRFSVNTLKLYALERNKNLWEVGY